jgi:GTP-binding protein
LEELGRYQPELLDRPRLIVGSRADMAEDWTGSVTDLDRMSAVTGAGVDAVVNHLAQLVSEARQALPTTPGIVIHRPEAEGVLVERDMDGAFIVRGRPARRAVAVNDLTNAEALAYVQHRLRQLGVDRALVRAGAHEGDVVRVGDFTFTYEPDR